MERIITYLKDVLGLEINLQPLAKAMKDKLPLYLKEGYQWYEAELADRSCLLAEIKEANTFGIAQMEKHFGQVKASIGLPVIAVFDKMEAYNRKRFIERKMAFIVPEKQLYMPDFFIDLKEFGNATPKKELAKLTPTAQQILLFYILDQQQNKQLENKTFKELAAFLGSNPMAITRAVENLKFHELIEVKGDKEKSIRFMGKGSELWTQTLQRNLLVNPVIKRVYVDEEPNGISLLNCNESALPEYSDMNPSRQKYLAVEKNMYYGLQKNNALLNANIHEGRICLEVWRYNPEILVGQLPKNAQVIDPLSLYLSLRDSADERIEMALEQIIEKFIW